jgi:hypothetical protein
MMFAFVFFAHIALQWRVRKATSSYHKRFSNRTAMLY